MAQPASYKPMLLDRHFERWSQGALWDEEAPMLRYVIKLHEASRLHYDFRLEVYGVLFSLVLEEPPCLHADVLQPVLRVDDHDMRFIYSEHRVPAGEYNAGPTLVWDTGTYQPVLKLGDCDEGIVYDQLLNGRLDFTLNGIRLQGSFRLTGEGENWELARLPGQPVQPPRVNDLRSVLSDKSLDEIW